MSMKFFSPARLYGKLFYLKFVRGLSTVELMDRFPEDIHEISEIALLGLPWPTLRKVVREKSALSHLLQVKRNCRYYLTPRSSGRGLSEIPDRIRQLV